MARIHTILVPVDFAPASDHALAFAIDLAATLGARVHVISAYQLPLYSFPDGALVASADIATKLSVLTQNALDKTVAEHRDPRVEITSRIELGDPREAILEAARDMRADLIVMGTHGRRGFARALIGSVAESVIRSSEVPVLTIHDRPKSTVEGEPK